MKRIAFAVALIGVAACTAQEEAPVMDTAAPAAAPAPEPMMDTTMTDTSMVDTMTTDSVTPPSE